MSIFIASFMSTSPILTPNILPHKKVNTIGILSLLLSNCAFDRSREHSYRIIISTHIV